MTLEAAILIPLFLFVMMTLLSVMEMFYFYGKAETELLQIGRKMAIYAPAAELIAGDEQSEPGSIATTVLGDQYAKISLMNHLNESDIRAAGLVGGYGGISFIYSNIMTEGDLIDLAASYRLEPRNNFFLIPDFQVINRCRMRAWTGYDITKVSPDNETERMVYITETGTVFHLTETCTYLDLSIHPVTRESISGYRNQSGVVYRSCEICGSDGDTYYITDYGDCYHVSLSCSGLKRTIMVIPISQVGDRRACSRCGVSG